MHQVVDNHSVIQLGIENNLSYVVQHDDSKELVVVGEHWEEVAARGLDGLDQVAQTVATTYNDEIIFYQTLHIEQMPSGGIFVMGQQVALGGQLAGIDGMTFKRTYTKVSDGRRCQQGHQKSVAAGNLSDEEGSHKGSMHDTGHHSGHSHQGEIGSALWRQPELVAQHGDEIAAQTT